MEGTSVSIDWATAIPVLVSTLAPTIVGFLQQFSKGWADKAPWWAKGLISSAVASLIGMITAYAASGDALMATAGGAIVGAFGAVNIAFRKGSRGNLEVSLGKAPVPPTP